MFDTGVSGYVTAKATVTVYFPIDNKGVPYICCEKCPYLSRNSRMCHLNGKLVEFPNKYVGSQCPLKESAEK